MLLKQYEMTDQLYNPLNHLSQTELMEKFNLAFYEAQNLSKTDILTTFNENFADIHNNDDDKTTDDDYLIDYLILNPGDKSLPVVTPNGQNDISFVDFTDFSSNNYNDNPSEDPIRPHLPYNEQQQTVENFDTETFTTENSFENDVRLSPANDQVETGNFCSSNFSQFFVPPTFIVQTTTSKTEPVEKVTLENLGLANIDLCDGLSASSFDLDELSSDLNEIEKTNYDYEVLPPVGTITKNNVDFNNFLRSVPPDDINFFAQDTVSRNEFGHLIGTKCVNNNFITDLTNSIEEESENAPFFGVNEDNHMILTQTEALLNDDPLLSSSSLMYPSKTNEFVQHMQESNDGDYSNDCEEVSSLCNLQCKWEQCYQLYDSQTSLVKHIEKCHVELKRGDEFTCFWENCPRKIKPFNARYKLLIHMRVHSGEKPNKCPFKGCNKAFSRLENLKIHQRSHTGERPYLCQFASCTKSFSNSSDRAKHQRTHFDTKPYACQVSGCTKKYTDPSSLRKHVKNHTYEEQMQIKKKTNEDSPIYINPALAKKYFDPNKQKAVKHHPFYTNFEHNYSNQLISEKKYDSINIKQDLKNKISEKNKLRKLIY